MSARRKPAQVLERRSREAAGRRTREAAGSDLAVTVVASLSIAAPLLFYLHQHVEMLRYGYAIESQKHERSRLVEKRRELQSERDRAASLGRVEEQATLIGLEPPPASAIYAVGGPSDEEEAEPSASARHETSGDAARPAASPRTRTARLE